MKNTQKIKAFTLVELIIVITILAILRTIGFMSFQTYTGDSRDGKRKTDLSEVRKGLEIYQTKNGILPIPDEQIVNIMSGTNVISYQGYLGKEVQKIIRVTNDVKDTKDNNYYTYSTNGTKTKYQLLAMLENNPNLAYNENINKNTKLLNQTYARIDYTTRYAYTTGNKVGIFFSGSTNEIPIQNTMSGNLDLSSVTKQMKVIFSNGTTNSGTIIATGSSLSAIVAEEIQSVATAQQETPRINSCSSTQPTCSPAGCTIIIGTPTSIGQAWLKDVTNCGFTCNVSYSGTNCEIYTAPGTISSCPTVNRARNRTIPTRATILTNINDYIGCTVAGYTGVIGGYTYSGSIIPANKMVMIVETNNTAGVMTTQWGLNGTDLGTLANITARTNTVAMTNNIVSWDGLSNTQKIVTVLGAGTTYAAQKCNAKGAGTRYLPATEELNQLYCYNNNNATDDSNYGPGINHADCINKGYIARNKNTLSNFVADTYLSSNEYGADFLLGQHFYIGERAVHSKSNGNAVRCVSRF